jgi:tripartite-type tricarboxylate transporter receptor subunit TctC
MARSRLSALLVATGVSLGASAAFAQESSSFYKNRTFSYIISAGAGGGYDLYGRLVAEFMQRQLPGSTFVVKNMAGAGHLIGANALYASPIRSARTPQCALI